MGCGRCGGGAAAAKSKRRGGLLRILGDVDQHRTGPASGGDLEGEADGGRDVFSARDQEVVLGDGQSDAGDVDFLEGVGAEDFATRPAR